MSYVNKHLARTLEQQHKRSVRSLFLKIQDLNNDCVLLRKRLEQLLISNNTKKLLPTWINSFPIQPF
ncbi:hypothetical protein LSPH26S_04661 [Lysinibacillus sphaericus]